MTAPLARAKTADAAIAEEKCIVNDCDILSKNRSKDRTKTTLLGEFLKRITVVMRKNRNRYEGTTAFDTQQNCGPDSESGSLINWKHYQSLSDSAQQLSFELMCTEVAIALI